MARRRNHFQALVRAFPIRWRVLAISGLNSGLALILLLSIWNGSQVLGSAWSDLREARRSERLLTGIERDAGRLEVLAHRYVAQPDPGILAQIDSLRAALAKTAQDDVKADALAGDRAESLNRAAEGFLAGFDALRGSMADAARNAPAGEPRPVAALLDGGSESLRSTFEQLTTRIRDVETAADRRYEATFRSSTDSLALAAPLFIVLVGFIGLGVAQSISQPMSALCDAMLAIADGSYDRTPPGILEADEIGDMARAVEVFRQNALGKLKADEALHLAKESAEESLSELRTTQASLVEAEKLAALGGLVAGVAHEINNPVGIGLTVASSLTHRCKAVARDLAENRLRRSDLTEFIGSVEHATLMIVANLDRAGELVRSFKQVAVDRSHHERRRFDLAETLEQIAASLRPGCRSAKLTLDLRVSRGVTMESYPGPIGQIVTNLCLNAMRHGFPKSEGGLGEGGVIELSAGPADGDRVAITLRDNGRGMSDEVRRRAFEPFFTTRRGEGGTGLGLHIVFNIVTHQLGGRITLASEPGAGCRFDILIPLVAPFGSDTAWMPQFA